MTPGEAARRFTSERKARNLKRATLSISGGECTLNRPWLIQFIRELADLNSGLPTRIQVNSNGSLLTHSYIDDLAAAGMTDVVIDLKARRIENFMRITGIKDRNLADRYGETAWEAVRYVSQQYSGKVYLGVGVPYNRDLNPSEEIRRMGERLYKIDPFIPVNIQNYRPAFRSRIIPASDSEVRTIYQMLRGIGLKVVIYQTETAFMDD